MEAKCGAACEGGGKEFASESSVIYAWKKEKKKKKITYRAPVSFLWQPEGYYRTLPFIMKGLQLTGSETGWGEGGTVRRIFPPHSWDTEGKGMNE